MGDLPDWLQAMRGRREEPQRRPIVDPQVTARLRRDFGGDAFGQMGRDFRSGFDQMAVNARQGLPRRAVTALSNSGIPGWQGLARQRSMTDAVQAGLAAPQQVPQQRGVSLSEVLAGGSADDVPAPPMPALPPRGFAPPEAPAVSPYEMENEAFRRALERARGSMRGNPDPTGLRAAAQRDLEPYRAAAEWDRRRLDNRQSFTSPPISKRR